MSGIEVRVDGLSALNDLFKDLPQQVGQRALKQSLLHAAQPLLQELKSRTPVQRTGNANKRTGGTLLASMKAKYGRSPEPTTAVVVVGTNIHYSKFVEFGTKKPHGGIAARHFMRDAFESASQQVIDTFVADTADIVQRRIDRWRSTSSK